LNKYKIYKAKEKALLDYYVHIFCAIKRINQWIECVIKESEKATKKRIIGKSPKIRHTK
jgi:hypothetical protein